MTREEAKSCISTIEMLQRLAYNIHGVMDVIDADNCEKIIKALEQEPSGDLISRQAVLDALYALCNTGETLKENPWRDNPHIDALIDAIEDLPSVEQEPKIGQYEKHTDHTDCIWYGNDSGCPVTCSQYRDGWNDAMDYIFKNGKGYQPYRHDG